MRIDPEIAKLRRNPALQRRAQAAVIAAGEKWRQEPQTAAMIEDLHRFGSGAPLDACPVLDAVFVEDEEAASAVAGALVRRLARVLECEPFAHPPFRHGFDGQVSTLLLARAGAAQLILHAREPGSWHHTVAGFSGALRHEVVLAGSARGRVVRIAAAPPRPAFSAEPIDLRCAVRLTLDLSYEALQVEVVERRLVTLRLHRLDAAPDPRREYRLADGALLHQSAGDIGASRLETMLALLGRMGRSEAAPEIAALALEPGDDSLRWQALRECLALDTGEGFRALCHVARTTGDPLVAPAGALRAQLLETHPQLAALEHGPCRA